MTPFYKLILFFAIIFLPVSVMAQNSTGVAEIPGRLVFKLKPEYKHAARGNEIKLPQLNAALANLQATNLLQKFPKAALPENNPEAVDLTLIYEIRFNPLLKVSKIQQALLQTGFLEYAEPLRSFEPLYQPNDPKADSTKAGYQFHLKNIRAYRGWDFDKGDTSVVIGILDTGIRYTHKDLTKNLKYNYADPIDGIDNDNDGYIDNFRGWDLADNDNNANFDANGHGVVVTGVAAASTDNGKGVAGVGFKCKYMPIKIYPSLITGSFAGFEAVVYAADHGCNVINLSWGGANSPSAYEQDVITYAVINKDAVVVAAAGNTNGLLDFYPSSYKNVVSVGSLKSTGVKVASHTYSYQIDLCANGEGIGSTNSPHDSAYANNNATGSSFACPQVSGAAGLVRHKFPQYNAQQIGEQLRVTADPKIYALTGNAAYQEKLGKGILDVAKALTTTNAKSVRITNLEINKGELLYPGDTLEIQATFKNYLQPLTNLAVTLTSPSAYVTILQPTFTAGAMATLASKSTVQPFRVLIKPNMPVNERVALRFGFSDGTYTDYQYFERYMNPDYVTLNINKLAVTVNSYGNIGFNTLAYDQGNGVRYRKMNLFSQGGFMVGNSATEVSDNVIAATALDADFTKLVAAHFIANPLHADQEVAAEMQDLYPAAGMAGVNVKLKAYAWQNAPKDKFVILEYTIHNKKSTPFTNLYAGIFADWDILYASKNVAKWDAATKMGYVYNVPYDTIFAGIKLLTSGAPSYYALDLYSPAASTINITDGFTDAEKYQTLSGGLARTTAGSLSFGNDVGYVIGSALGNLAPNDSAVVAFAVLAGDNLTQLQANAAAAQNAYTLQVVGLQKENQKAGFSIYPNPASKTVYLEIPQEAGSAAVEIHTVSGQLVSSFKGTGNYELDTAGWAPGTYLVKIVTAKNVFTRKLLISK